jgi:hypothetical protein
MLDTPALLFLLAALVFLYAILFALPFLPIDRNLDAIIFLTEAKRMYEGELMYRDFFEFVTPGTPLVYLCLFKIFGVRLWIPNMVIMLLGLGFAFFSIVIARKLMGAGLAILSGAIFLVRVYKCYPDPTHHWFSALTAAAALAVLIERRTLARIVTAGSLCGLSAFFTQSRGLMVALGFGLFLWWECRQRQEDWRRLLKKVACMIAGFCAAFLASITYFIYKAGLARFVWCTVIFVFKFYPKLASSNTFLLFRDQLPTFASLIADPLHFVEWFFLVLAVPCVLVLFFVRYSRESREKPMDFWERPMLLAIVGSCMILGIAPAPGLHRIASSAFPAVILLGWFLDSPRKLARALTAALAVGVLLVIPHTVTVAQRGERWILTTPQGKLAVESQQVLDRYNWVQQHTRPLDYYYYPVFPYVYLYLNLRNPTPFPFIWNSGYTTPEQVQQVIRGLDHHQVRYVHWSPRLLDRIPDWEDPLEDHLGPLRDYIHEHYLPVKLFSNSEEIWERKDETSPAGRRDVAETETSDDPRAIRPGTDLGEVDSPGKWRRAGYGLPPRESVSSARSVFALPAKLPPRRLPRRS